MTSLALPAFIAGLLTFLAPCTLPLLPGYLGFISGSSADSLARGQLPSVRRKIFINGLLYVIGFSVIFLALGTLFGLGGSALFQYRMILSRVGGVFVIIFGLYMLGILKLGLLDKTARLPFVRNLKPGSPVSSLVFGATFAFGWTPCVGPVLGSVLTLAASSATVGTGAGLLGIFSLGLALPFLAIALGAGSAVRAFSSLTRYLGVISKIGGVFLIMIGALLITEQFNRYVAIFYRWFNILDYEALLNYF